MEEEARKAKESGDPRLYFQAVDRLTKLLDLRTKVDAEVQTGPTTNVQVNLLQTAEWQEARQRLLAALEPFPEARTAIGRAFGNPSLPSSSGSPSG